MKKDCNNGLGYYYIIKYKEPCSNEEKVKESWWYDTNDTEEAKNDFLKYFPDTTITYIALYNEAECKKYHQEQINIGFARFVKKLL